MLLAVYPEVICILGCLLLCVLQQCLSSCWVFCCPCWLHGFCMTISLLWMSMFQACMVSSFCTGEFLIDWTEVSALVLLYLSWRLQPVACGLWWYLPLWQRNSGTISLAHAVSIMFLLSMLLYFLSAGDRVLLPMQSILGCSCFVHHLMYNLFNLWSAVPQLPILLQMHLLLS